MSSSSSSSQSVTSSKFGSLLLLVIGFCLGSFRRKIALVVEIPAANPAIRHSNNSTNKTPIIMPATGLPPDQLVQSYYQESYAKMDHYCRDFYTDKPFEACIKGLQAWLQKKKNQDDETNNNKNNSALTGNWPWWLVTMIRDASTWGSGVFGPWHNKTFNAPHLHICALEKVGMKHWTRLHCQVNAKYEGQGPRCYPPADVLVERQKQMGSATKSVFLRDPLERFLSGFLDKCERGRTREPHCRPADVWGKDAKNPLFLGLADNTNKNNNNKQTFFQAYVDTIPLEWDMHFFPQSFFCNGLYRHISDYQFVGKMGPTFYQDMQKLGEMMQDQNPQFTQILDQEFKYSAKLAASSEIKLVGGIEQSASTHVLEYYTPRTVQRVLEYTSIDYMHLGLPVPTWAIKMLQQQDELQG